MFFCLKKFMIITFLGTACMQPTKDRNHPGILLSYKAENILMDCGEGIQRQLRIAGIKASKITKLLISHWHGDHILGIPGLMQTMGASEYSGKLEIFGPVGSKLYLENMFKSFSSTGTIDYSVKEITKPGKFFECEDFLLEAAELEHGIPTLGFSFVEKDRRKIKLVVTKKLGIPEGPLLGELQRGNDIVWKGDKVKADDTTSVIKGRKVTYISDSLPCNGALNLAKYSDLLISEASFASSLKDKAEEYKHMTAREAALMANRSESKKLVLTHFSQRYKETSEIEEDAKDVFADVVCARDFMKINL